MEIFPVEITRPRREFGRPINDGRQSSVKLEDTPVTLLTWPDAQPFKPTDVKVAAKLAGQWVERAVTSLELDCIPNLSQHTVSTETFTQASRGTSLTEGAGDVKAPEAQRGGKAQKKLKNEIGWATSVLNLVKSAETAIEQNNTLDLMEEYFVGTEQEHFNFEPPSCRSVSVFRDPSSERVKRSAVKISWHPEAGSSKLAVAYSTLQFQAMPTGMPAVSYIWDVNRPNQPDAEIVPTSPLTCLVYNPRLPDHLVGGSYNGLIGFWDLRKGSSPVDSSLLENSHRDPVYDVFWVQSRTGNECVSVSTDGTLLWWDIRKLAQGPTDQMPLNLKTFGDSKESKAQTQNLSATATSAQLAAALSVGGASSASSGLETKDFNFGGTAAEYRSDAGATRYLVGTEQGTVLLCDRKPKKDLESSKSIKTVFGARGGKHHGPIYSVQRNPVHNKYFLTIGDWTARVWQEETKTPIITTKYDSAYLTGGCWSPTRPGVFFTIKADGNMDVWDMYHKQNDPIFTNKVSEVSLTSIRVHQQGKLVALGAADGSVSVVELSDALSEPHKTEKQGVSQIFERETTREKNLNQNVLGGKKTAMKERRKTGLNKKALMTAMATDQTPAEVDSMIKEVEKDFYRLIDTNASAALSAEKEAMDKKSKDDGKS